MKTLEQLQEKQQKEREQFESEIQLRSELPEAIRDKALICFHSDHASVMMHNHYDTKPPQKLAGAVQLIREFESNIVESEHWKDGCVSVRPAQINSSANKERATMDGASAVEIKVDGGKGYGPTVKVEFYVQLAWGLIEISYEVTDLWKLVPRIENKYYQGETVSSKVYWTGHGEDQMRRWWSSPGSYSGSYYFADLPNFYAWTSNELTGEHAKALQVA